MLQGSRKVAMLCPCAVFITMEVRELSMFDL